MKQLQSKLKTVAPFYTIVRHRGRLIHVPRDNKLLTMSSKYAKVECRAVKISVVA